MRPEIVGKQEWAGVETTAGFWWVPIDVLTKSELESARRGDFEPLLKYTEGSRVYSDQSSIKSGYGVRLSAPGYMDSTDWEVYGSKKEALKRARQLAKEAEGEDYATMKKPRSHATKKTVAQLERLTPGHRHSTKKSPTQLDREIAEVTGVGAWKKSDQPYNSEHFDVGHASARVKPTSTYSGADYEWTIWIGPPGRRVLHQSGETKTRAGAKRMAQQKIAALR
jgi:hypothetical protein